MSQTNNTATHAMHIILSTWKELSLKNLSNQGRSVVNDNFRNIIVKLSEYILKNDNTAYELSHDFLGFQEYDDQNKNCISSVIDEMEEVLMNQVTITSEMIEDIQQDLLRCKKYFANFKLIVDQCLKKYDPELLKAIFSSDDVYFFIDENGKNRVRVTYDYNGKTRQFIRSEKVYLYAYSEYCRTMILRSMRRVVTCRLNRLLKKPVHNGL